VSGKLARQACARAARDGRLDVLKWALENGLQADGAAYEAAARTGRLDMLELLRAYKCAWGERCYHEARMDVCWWLRGQMCPGSFRVGDMVFGCTGTDLYSMEMRANTMQPMNRYTNDRFHYYYARPPPPFQVVTIHVPRQVYVPPPQKPRRPPRAPVLYVPPRHAAAHSRPRRGRNDRR